MKDKNRDHSRNTAQVRDRMIHETEVDINRHLDGPSVKWPRRCSPEQRTDKLPRGSSASDYGAVGSTFRVQQLWLTATIIEVRGNERGNLDKGRVAMLVDPLLELASDEQGGAFVIDLSSVRSFNAAFLTLLSTLRRTLASRNRRLSLCVVRSQNSELLRGSGLDDGVDFYATRAEALESIDREA